MYPGVQERVFVEDTVMVDQYGRVCEERVVVDDVYYGNQIIEERAIVEDVYMGNPYNNIYGEKVAVGQTAYLA